MSGEAVVGSIRRTGAKNLVSEARGTKRALESFEAYGIVTDAEIRQSKKIQAGFGSIRDKKLLPYKEWSEVVGGNSEAVGVASGTGLYALCVCGHVAAGTVAMYDVLHRMRCQRCKLRGAVKLMEHGRPWNPKASER